jgi:S-adenosylmethionine:tRNA ribosyltransferase-isomerase
MRASDFHYELPRELIAQCPPERRGASRLLCLDADDALSDRVMSDFPQQLRPGDLLVFNDTKVIPARLFGSKETGGRVEILVERLLDEREMLVQLRASKAPKPGARIFIEGADAALRVCGREGEFYRLAVDADEPALALLERAGHVPLPPYIERSDEAADRDRYQTLFARHPGAVAAPTAGLHFDDALIAAIRARGVRIETLTLHVGAGTFQPVRVDDLERHRMHAERYEIGGALCAAIEETRAHAGRVVAIGTTSVRALESAAAEGEGGVRPGAGETRLFITPGYRFRVVDALFTNFHLPESTLLMLVCAFAGYERTMRAYAHAVRERYRFFSYGDAMWVPRHVAGGVA